MAMWAYETSLRPCYLRSRETRRHRRGGWEVFSPVRMIFQKIFLGIVELWLWSYWNVIIRIVWVGTCENSRCDQRLGFVEYECFLSHIGFIIFLNYRHPLVVSWSVKGREACLTFASWFRTDEWLKPIRRCCRCWGFLCQIIDFGIFSASSIIGIWRY